MLEAAPEAEGWRGTGRALDKPVLPAYRFVLYARTAGTMHGGILQEKTGSL